MASTLGLGLFAFPRYLVQGSGRGGFYAVVGLVGLAFLATALMLLLAERFPGQTPVEIQRRVFGRIPTLVITIATQLALLAMLAAVYIIFANLMSTVVLQRTPGSFIALTLALSALCAAWHGPHSLGRGLQMLLLPATILLFVGVVLSFSNVRPIQAIPHWSGWPSTARSVLGSSYLLFGLPSLMVFLGWTDLRKSRLWVAAGVTLNSLVLISVYLIVVGTLGVPATAQMQWPSAIVIKLISLPGFLVQRVGYLVIIIWSMMQLAFIAVNGLAMAVNTAQSLGMPGKRFRWLLAFIVLSPVAATLIIRDVRVAYMLVQRYLVWSGLGLLIAFPAVTLGWALVTGKSGPPVWTWRTPSGWDEGRLPLGTPPGDLPSGKMSAQSPESQRVLRRHL